MIVGYARVSSEEQKLDLQLRALQNAGCNRIFQDHGQPGHNFERNGLEDALTSVKPGGTLVVWRLDRLGRSLSGLIQVIEKLGQREVQFKSIMENIDTSSSGGKLVFHMMAALAEFERTLISERTRAGLVEAKRRGKLIGRPKALSDWQVAHAAYTVFTRKAKIADVANEFGVSVRTMQRHLREAAPTVASP